MPLVIPPGFADIAIEMRCVGDPDPWYVTFGVDSSSAAGDGNQVGIAANEAWAHIMTVVSDDVTHTGCKVTVGQDGAEPIRYFISEGAGVEGTSAAAKLPQNCAALVHKQTAVGGRRARGRFFLPGILDEGSVDNVGVIAGAHLLQLQNAADAMFAELVEEPLPYPMFVLHNSVGVSPLIDPTEVSSLRVDNVVSTQRRRLR